MLKFTVKPLSQWGAVLILVLMLFTAPSVLAGNIRQESFSSKGAFGEPVNAPLPIYRARIEDGKLIDQSTSKTFSSFVSQRTTSKQGSLCRIKNLDWGYIYYTTFYVVLESNPNELLLVNSCGKSPLQLYNNQQYDNIRFKDKTDTNFINHAQIAGKGKTVIAAGEIDVIDGKIVYIDNCSGHFQPTVGSFLYYISHYLQKKDAMLLTKNLNEIVATGSISQAQINANLIYNIDTNNSIPAINVRAGTGGCYGYTTVFNFSTGADGKTTLSGGLLAYHQGPIQVFQSDINTITKKNIKSIELTDNVGYYKYDFKVAPDCHFTNTAMDFSFVDESGDSYGNLAVHVFCGGYNHDLDYDSKAPNIKEIKFWDYW